jgi:hypothetical protein
VRRNVLIAMLGTYGLLAFTPAFIWLTAVLFDRVDDRLRDALSALAVTLPVGLGFAAVTLAVHGLALNARFHEEAAEELLEMQERQLAVVAAGTAVAADGAPAGPASVAAGPRMAKTARVAPPQRTKGERAKRRATNMARRELRRSTRFFR